MPQSWHLSLQRLSRVLFSVASFTKEVNSRLHVANGPLVFNGPLANRGLTPLVKEATGQYRYSHFDRKVVLVGRSNPVLTGRS